MQPPPAISTATPLWRTLRQRCGRCMSRFRTVLMLIAVVIVLMKATGEPPQWLLSGTDSLLVLVAACVIYALLLAIPFIPSVEIGLLIMILFGAPGALGAYIATCAGLSSAYLIGRRFGHSTLLERYSLPGHYRGRFCHVVARLPAGLLPALSLAMLLNLPGNTAFGGGGGIAMAYGAGRLLSGPAFTGTVAVATGILPLAVVTGLVGLEELADLEEPGARQRVPE